MFSLHSFLGIPREDPHPGSADPVINTSPFSVSYSSVLGLPFIMRQQDQGNAMSRTLGLDLGTNSIGWAIIEDGKQIVKSGVRIFPVGVKEEDFLKNGSEVSKNIGRRITRGSRRRKFRYKLRRKRLEAILKEYGMLPTGEDFFSTRELYELRVVGLDSQLTLPEFGRILLMLNKRRGFKSNRKTLSTEEAKKEEGKVKADISKLQNMMDEKQCRTVGEYFALLFRQTDSIPDWHSKDTPIEHIRRRFVGREMYIKEFEELWNKQATFYSSILTPALRTKIRDEIIYYQRNLKSQKGLVGRCRFEPNKRCTQRSSLLFQEFRIWQQLSSLRFASGQHAGKELTNEQKRAVFNFLMKQAFGQSTLVQERLQKKLKKELGLAKEDTFNDVPLIGNTTQARFIEAFGEEMFDSLTQEQRFEFWHILTYTDNSEKLKTIVRKKIEQGILPAFSEELLCNYSEINLEQGYCSFSSKALKKILPFLREGMIPYDAFIKAGYNPTRKAGKQGTEEITKIPPLAPNELRNPIVQQMLSETFRVVNAIVKEYGKPDMIRVEMARELKKPKTKREEARNKSIQKRKQREEHAVFLSAYLGHTIEPNDPEVRKYELWLEMGCEDTSMDDLDSFLRHGRVSDIKKYRLWLECNRISVYSGQPISLTRLFNSDVEIEHILPYSKTMNNEFTNLCLCEREINLEKGKRLPCDYFASKGEKELQKFKDRVSRLNNEAKQRRFLAKEIPDDFLNSQIVNTSYAARELHARLEILLPPVPDGEQQHLRVQVVNGQATATLRRLWGLNSILSKGDIDTKNRGDHRHHAIDAIVIACTTPSLLHTLATYSKFSELNKLTNDHIEQPWNGFLTNSGNSINSIIVSYRNQKRLVGKKPNKIKVKNLEKYPNGYFKQSAVTIRGSLHEETYYGLVNRDDEQVYVTRWSLQKFTKEDQLDKVLDDKVREVLKERVKRFGGDLKKAFSENPDDPVYMYSLNGSKIPIKKVRIVNPSENLVEVRPNVFVESGNNYCIAIYGDMETGKFDFETVPFWYAVQKTLIKETLVPPFKNGKPFLFTLTQRDIVVRYKNHPDEIEWNNIEYLRDNIFRVRKFDVVGQIFLDYLYASKIDKTNDRNKLFYQVSPNSLNCVKVEIDIIGNITKKEGI